MSIQPSTTPIPESAFPSLAALRAAHSKLLEAHRTQNGSDPDRFWQEVERFLHRGRRVGALLDREEERLTAQSLLDYWAATAYSMGRELADAALVDFDPTLAPEIPEDQCPYVGLAAFHEGREKYFFGRERLVTDLLTKVKEARLVAVVGPSGSGKSSLVLAGLLPLLKDGAIAGDGHTSDSETWRFLPRLVPGSDPPANLAYTLHLSSTDLIIDDVVTAQDQVAEYDFRHDPTSLVNLLNATGKTPVVLVVDQFEEIFTLCTDDQTRALFISTLLALVQSPGLRHTVILTMRTDFESFVARLPDFLPHFEAALVRVTPLNAAELRAVIEKPAEMVGLKFEAGVVDALLQDVLGEPAALPLLQFTLLKLWENRERNRITWTSYQRLGGGRLALARSADRLYDSLIPEEQVTARRILLRLVRPGEGLEVTSNRVRQGVLYQTGEAHDRVDRVLQKLVDADLLRLTTGERPEDTQVEVAHEALVRNWPRLVGWLEDDRGRLRERLRLTEAAEQWLKLGSDPGALLRGALLEDALRYTDLNELEQHYVKTSQAALAVAEQEKEAIRQRELAQALALAKSERQWAEFQEKSASGLRRRNALLTVTSVIAILLAVAAFFFYSRATTARHTAEDNALAAATARSEAEAQATMAALEAANARNAEATAKAEAAVARTAEAEARAKQERLRHLSAALNYTGEQLNELEQIINNALLTPVAPPTADGDDDDDDNGRATPVASPIAVAPSPTVTPWPSPVSTPEAGAPVTGTDSSAGIEPVTEPSQDLDSVTASTSLTMVTAIVPDIEINLYENASEDAPVLQSLRAPMRLSVLQADAYWVKVATPDGVVGWVQAWMLTYTGNTAKLPRALSYLAVAETTRDSPVQAANRLPFTFGVVVSVDGAASYPLIDDPQNPTGEVARAPVGANVTLLFDAQGPTSYGSGIWFYVQMADPDGQNFIWQGYLPAEVIAPR